MARAPGLSLAILLVAVACAGGAYASYVQDKKVPKRSRIVRVTEIASTSHRTDGDRYFEIDRLDQAILQLEKEGWTLAQVSAIDAENALLLVERGD